MFMKKVSFYNAPIFFMTALLLLQIITSCKKNDVVSGSDPNEQLSSAKGKPNTLPEVFLKLTVNDAAGNKITSDGGGDYINGTQSFNAKFDQSGNFILACGSPGHGAHQGPPVRWMNINFDSPVVVYIPPPITGSDKVTGITTGSVAAFTFIPLQNLEVGQSECVGLTGGSGAEWVMNFHRNASDESAAYAVFTRINATQWTVAPAGSCSPNSNVCALRYGAGTLYGFYNMPFSFTLTKL
jgi:hypothetical protein